MFENKYTPEEPSITDAEEQDLQLSCQNISCN